jgi:hypothetical protein
MTRITKIAGVVAATLALVASLSACSMTTPAPYTSKEQVKELQVRGFTKVSKAEWTLVGTYGNYTEKGYYASVGSCRLQMQFGNSLYGWLDLQTGKQAKLVEPTAATIKADSRFSYCSAPSR